MLGVHRSAQLNSHREEITGGTIFLMELDLSEHLMEKCVAKKNSEMILWWCAIVLPWNPSEWATPALGLPQHAQSSSETDDFDGSLNPNLKNICLNGNASSKRRNRKRAKSFKNDNRKMVS